MGRVAIVLLAAGRSSRMRGTDKLLEGIGGVPLIRVMAERALSASDDVVVVLPPESPARETPLAGLPLVLARSPGVYASMSKSLAAGIRAAPGWATGVLVLLADMPEIETADLMTLVQVHALRPDRILRAATEDGRPGHPVLFPSRHRSALLRLVGDRGARELLEALESEVDLVRLPGDRALVDLDTPEDWTAWRGGQPSATS